MRRSPRFLFLALATTAVLLAAPTAEIRASKADREEAEQQKREAAAEARLRAASRRMAEVLIQEEIARKERLARQDQAAAEAAAQEERAAQQVRGPEQIAGAPEDTGLDAVFGRNERLTAPTGSQDRYYMPESIPQPGTASGTATSAPAPMSPQPAVGEPGLSTVPVPVTPQARGNADLELFHSGYSNYSKGDFAAARQSFASFLAANPGHELADSAQYWLGQCAAAEGNYSQALAEYRRVIESFPFGDKVPDALLKSGEALMELGQEAEARRAWEQLARDFPDTGAGRRARERLGEGADVASADAL